MDNMNENMNFDVNNTMIEGIIIAILFIMAVGYLARIIYKSYHGESVCASDCCDSKAGLNSKFKVQSSKSTQGFKLKT
jgi:hypothetical protein